MDLNLEFIVKALAGIVSAVAIFKNWSEILFNGRKKLYEEYKFSSDFLRRTAEQEKLHPFALEKGYQALAGTKDITGNEVEHILKLENPVKGLNDFVMGKKYLKIITIANQHPFEFKAKYRKKVTRTSLKYFYYILYGVNFVIAISPFFFEGLKGPILSEGIKLLFVSIPVYGYFAFLAIRAGVQIQCAESLVQDSKMRFEPNK
jgi:hypothetical protein